MAGTSEISYRQNFNRKYRELFYNAWKISRFSPVQGVHWLKTLARQKKMEVRRQAQEIGGLMIPPVMILSATSRCNLACKGCYASKRMESCSSELSLERISTLFREASDLGIGVIMIAGGEPLMRPEILWAASEHRNIVFPIFTNGTLLNSSSISYFKFHPNLLPILSIEGNRLYTDARRGSGVYTRLLQNLDQLKQARRMAGISVTLTCENFEEVTHPVWMKEFVDRGCRLFFLVEYVPQNESDLALCLREEQKDKLQGRLELLRKQMPALFVSLPGDEKNYGGCLAAGRGFVHIGADGALEPCPFAPFSDLNISNISLKDALRSPFLAKLRDSHHLLSETQGGCTLWENREWVNDQLTKAQLSA